MQCITSITPLLKIRLGNLSHVTQMNVMRTMWIFKHKSHSNGSLELHKACLVCDGKSQQVGIDCWDPFSLIVNLKTILTALSIALSRSWSVHRLDATNLFLRGTLNETVYIYQHMGFPSKIHLHYVCRHKKSLYGLKKAPRTWYQQFTDFVLHLRFTQSQCDNTLFILHFSSHTIYLYLHVDDILLTSSSEVLRQQLMYSLANEFSMKYQE